MLFTQNKPAQPLSDNKRFTFTYVTLALSRQAAVNTKAIVVGRPKCVRKIVIVDSSINHGWTKITYLRPGYAHVIRPLLLFPSVKFWQTLIYNCLHSLLFRMLLFIWSLGFRWRWNEWIEDTYFNLRYTLLSGISNCCENIVNDGWVFYI